MVYTTCVRVYNCTYIIVPPTSPAMCVSLHICALICADVCLGRRWYGLGCTIWVCTTCFSCSVCVSTCVFICVFICVYVCLWRRWQGWVVPRWYVPPVHAANQLLSPNALVLLPIQTTPTFLIWKVFPDCEIDPLEFINFRLRHVLPNVKVGS